MLALTPHLAAWAKTLIDGALGAAGTNAASVGFDKLGNLGVLYPGLTVLGEGSILTGLVFAAIAVFIIEREFLKAAQFALAGGVLTFFGFMHGPAVGVGNGLGVTPGVTLAYLLMAAFLWGCARYASADSLVPAKAAPAAHPAE